MIHLPSLRPFRSGAAVGSLFLVFACGSADDDKMAAVPGTGSYKSCRADQRWGEFVMTIDGKEKSTGFESSSVKNGVEALQLKAEVAKSGLCRIMQPPLAPTCKPECDVGKQCTGGVCVPTPVAQNLGTVTITGLTTSVTLDNFNNLYSINDLPYPGFKEGAALTLKAAGANGYGPFTITAYGIAPLVAPSTPIPAETGKASTITWTAAAQPDNNRVLIDFSVNLHGVTDTWLICEVPDTGAYTIDASLMTELFKRGISGFPRVNLVRQSAGATTVKEGCVHFLVTSTAIERPLAVPGLVSCNDAMPCPGGKTCQGDLTCPK